LQISSVVQPSILLALLPGAKEVLNLPTGISSAYAAGPAVVKPATNAPTAAGGSVSGLFPRGPTHCPRLAQTLLRILAATHPWEALPLWGNSSETTDAQGIARYLYSLLGVGSSESATLKVGRSHPGSYGNEDKSNCLSTS
jgi:hypothetical protein